MSILQNSILQNQEILKKYEKEIFHFKQTSLKTIENLENNLKNRLYIGCLFEDEEVFKKSYNEAMKLVKAEQILTSESVDTYEDFNIESIDCDYQNLINLITVRETYVLNRNKITNQKENE